MYKFGQYNTQFCMKCNSYKRRDKILVRLGVDIDVNDVSRPRAS